MANATLGNIPLLFDPDEVTWDFKMRAAMQSTIGGRVIQVFGTDLGDMTVLGQLGAGDRSRGDREGWQAAERLMTDITNMAQATFDDIDNTPVSFRVPSMGWSFNVHVKSISPVEHKVDQASPVYRLSLFIVEDVTKKVTTDITDKYIQRLMEGIGWEQSEYNGPTLEEVEELLAPYGGTVKGYMQGEFIRIISEGMGGSGGVGGGGFISGPEGLEQYLWALKMQESGGDYTVVNSIGAAGAYQYMPSTWANYKGYSSAHLAPPAVQDERAAKDASEAYDRYGSWEAHASIHYSGQWWPPDSPVRNRPQPGGPTIGAYINQVMARMGQWPGPGS